MIPRVPEPTVILGNRKYAHIRQTPQDGHAPGDAPGDGRLRRRGALEAQRRDVERPGQEPKDVIGPDPHASVRRVGQRLAEEEKSWSQGQGAIRAESRLVRSRTTLVERPRRAQNLARSVRPLRSRSIRSSASVTENRTFPGGSPVIRARARLNAWSRPYWTTIRSRATRASWRRTPTRASASRCMRRPTQVAASKELAG